MGRSIVALDVGVQKIGIARASLIAKVAEPLTTLANDNLFVKKLKDILNEQDADQLVVGLPRGLDGQNTKQTSYVRSFVDNLQLNSKIIFQDEALTSVKAREFLEANNKTYTKADIDAYSAVIILDDYLRESK